MDHCFLSEHRSGMTVAWHDRRGHPMMSDELRNMQQKTQLFQ
jgi:hypothetical protein